MSDKAKTILFSILFLFTIFSAFLIITTATKYNSDTSLSLLASQFAKGHISLEPTKELPPGDISIYNGKYYMYFGPLASIILVPFVIAFGKSFPQMLIGIGTLIISFFAVYSISKKFKFSRIDSLWLSLFFVFSTVLFSTSAINITSYLVEALGVPLILLALVEYLRKRRFLLVGLFVGLAILTRITLILAVVFFFLEYFQKRLSNQELIRFLSPVFISVFFLLVYNYLRFNSIFQTGYDYHIAEPFPLSKNFEYGAVSLMHIPANLYSLLIMPPEPILYYSKGFVFRFPYLRANPWGMAIWYTSPLFLMLLFKFKRSKYTLSALLTIVSIVIPLLIYFSVGFAQFGYRYALDFLPFLFLLLIPALAPKLSKTAILLITIGVIFNCIYITSLWDVYPHFGINR